MLIELEVEEKEEFQKDVICLNPIQLTLAFQHPLHSLDGRAVPTRPLVSCGHWRSTDRLGDKTGTHLWSADTGPKLEAGL